MNQQASFPIWLWLILLALALGSASLHKGFWGAHGESRRSEVGREVLEEGAWLIPTLNGEAFITKPPLLYWSIATSMALFGVNEAAARLPSILALLVSFAGMISIGRSLKQDLDLPEAQELDAGIALISMPLVLMMALNAETEPLLLMFTILSVAGWLRIPVRPVVRPLVRPVVGLTVGLTDPASFSPALVTGLFLAGGFMVKGPLGWLFPLFGILALEIMLPKEKRRARLSTILIVTLTAALVPLPWFLLVLNKLPHAMDIWLGESVARLADADFDVHREPVWYYFPRLLLFLPPLIVAILRPVNERGRRVLLLWLALGVFFLSMAASKRSHYLLSLAPAAALFPLLMTASKRILTRSLAIAGACLPLLVAIAIWIPQNADLMPGALGKSLATLLLTAGAMWVWRQASWQAFASGMILVLLIGGQTILPAVDAYRNPGSFYDQVAVLIPGDAEVYNWRNDRYSAAFHLHRHVKPLRSVEDIEGLQLDSLLILCQEKDLHPVPGEATIMLRQEFHDPFQPSRRRVWLLALLNLETANNVEKAGDSQ